MFAQRGVKRSRLNLVGIARAPARSRGTEIGLFRSEGTKEYLVEGANEFEGM